MKRLFAFLLLISLFLCVFSGCASKTPDQVIKEAKESMTLDDVNWTIPITINSTGETVEYTMAMAKEHELAKIFCSFRQYEDAAAMAPQVISIILEGVLFKSVLEDIGVTDAEYVIVHHNNNDRDYRYEKDVIMGDECVVGWIQNKKMVIQDSAPTYVAFGAVDAGVEDFVHSIKDITVY